MSEATTPTPTPNTVNWWELQVTDLDEAKRFYGAVFGWSFQSFGEGYEMITTPDGTPIGGLDNQTGKGEQPTGRGSRIYVAVTALEQTLDAVAANGGTVEQKRTLIAEDYGWWALFTDPSGLKIGLTTSNPA
jgi:uncharacterized protein